MSGGVIATIAFTALATLLILRVPIGVAMLTVGVAAYAFVAGWVPTLNVLKTVAFETYSSYTFSIVPLFLLMGEFASVGGISSALFKCANDWLGHKRGGVAMAAIAGSAGFGAIAGSSLATAATMGKVALPEMRRYGYSGALATGAVAAGGTLGILIPPSIVLVIYAILAEQNIAKLFAAAFLPGLLAVGGYLIATRFYVALYPQEGPVATRQGYRIRFKSLRAIWPVILIFVVVIGGIYGGIFTPTEAAAVGAFATGVLALAKGKLTFETISSSLLSTAQTTGMIFLIVLGAEVMNRFLALTRTPQTVADAIAGWHTAPLIVLGFMLLCYLFLGCIMDSLSMILLTIPVFFPLVMSLDFGMSAEETAIWFGILVLVTVEVGLITPPVGLNVFIINNLAEDVPLLESFRGVLPYLISDILRICLLVAFPPITLAALGWFF